jgi:hypothetical protein
MTLCKLHADDVKLYCILETNIDSEPLQFNINCLDDWSKKWQLAITSFKSAMLNVGRNELNQAHEIESSPAVKVAI